MNKHGRLVSFCHSCILQMIYFSGQNIHFWSNFWWPYFAQDAQPWMCWLLGWQPPTAHIGVPNRGRCWQHNVVVQGSLVLNWCKGKILYNITTGQVYNNLSKSSGVKQAPSKPILHRDRGRGLGWWLVALSPANPNTPLLAVDLDHGLGLIYVYNYVIDFSSLCSKSHLWYRDIWTPYSWFQGWKASEKIPNTLYFTMFKFRFIFSVCEYKLHALSDLSDSN